MKRIILVLIAGILFTACTDDKDCCVTIDTGITIKYLNGEGENLFEMDNGYDESKIIIYHKINGAWEEYYDGNLDLPKGITTIDSEDGKYLMIFPSTTFVDNNYSETKIEFSASDSDIIRTEIDKSESKEIVTKVWYNTELKWETFATERMFDVIK